MYADSVLESVHGLLYCSMFLCANDVNLDTAVIPAVSNFLCRICFELCANFLRKKRPHDVAAFL